MSRQNLLWAGLVSVFAILAMVSVGRKLDPRQTSIPPRATLVQVELPHLVYPYSVIPGGVRDVAALKSALLLDPLVAKHYLGFDVDSAVPIHIRSDELVYVSYRSHDKIYWTTHKVLLARDEQVLTDGSHLIRVRCGNRISFERQPGVNSLAEPSEFEMDLLPELFSNVTSMLPWKEGEMMAPVPDLKKTPPNLVILSAIPPDIPTRTSLKPLPAAPAVILFPPAPAPLSALSPEPGTFLTLGLGLLGCVLLGVAKSNKVKSAPPRIAGLQD